MAPMGWIRLRDYVSTCLLNSAMASSEGTVPSTSCTSCSLSCRAHKKRCSIPRSATLHASTSPCLARQCFVAVAHALLSGQLKLCLQHLSSSFRIQEGNALRQASIPKRQSSGLKPVVECLPFLCPASTAVVCCFMVTIWCHDTLPALPFQTTFFITVTSREYMINPGLQHTSASSAGWSSLTLFARSSTVMERREHGAACMPERLRTWYLEKA